MAAFRVLYVDDEPDLLELGKLFLEHERQFTVDTIDSAPAALTLLDARKYDAIIADYAMPDMDGIEFLKKVRSSGNTIPFILFTGRGREEVVIQAINEGADFYLQKGGDPIPQFTELSHKIHQAIQKRLAERLLLESQADLHTLVDSIQVGIVTIDAKTHKILSANPKALEMIGAGADEIAGSVCHQFICPAQAGNCPVTDLGKKVDLSERILLKQNGDSISVLKSVVSAVLDGKDVLIESFFDISERKQAEEERRAIYEQIAASEEELRAQFDMLTESEQRISESEAKFRGIFDTINDGVHMHEIGPDGKPGKFIEVNEAACRMLDYTREELLEHGPLDLVTDYHSRPPDEILGELSNTGHAIFETEHRRKDGTIIPVEINTHVVSLLGKRVAISAVRNISERNKAAEELRQKNLRLATINDLEREFAELPSGKRVEELAAKKLRTMSGAVVTVFSTYYPAEQLLKTSAIEFASGILESLPGSWETVTRWMGMQPDKVEIPISREMYQDISRSIVGRKNTITEISNGKIPPLVSASIQKLSGIDRFFHIAHIIDGELYGTSVIGLRSDRPDPSEELLESFAHMVAVSLRRQRAERALRESEEFSRGLVENLPDYVVIYGSEGVILYVNPSVTTALGYNADELIGQPVLAYVAEDYRDMVIANLASRKKGGNIPAYEIVIVRRDGVLRSVIVQGTSVQYRDAPATLLVLTDVTERSRAEKALRLANRQLGLLTGITRHDILNKVSVILGYLKIARTKESDPTIGEYLGKIESATSAIKSEIEFTRVYQDLGTHEPQWLEMDTVLPRSQVPATITLKADGQGIVLFADPMLKKVFLNLLDNSIRHGQRVSEIRVSSHPSGKDRVVVWEDNGVGIPANDKERIFEHGFGKNSGIGLFLAREILSLTGITITENGEPGKGARFEITVPEGVYRVTGV